MTKPSPHHQATPASRSAIGAVTDELFERERDTDSALLIKGAARPKDFEHQRIFAKVRGQLFGGDGVLQIGRYRVVRRIGKGGMGEVYLGEDAELGRRVALKRVLGAGSPREQARLRREAQLLAQLSHPNVVQVYEVGEHEGRTFLAMEYVEGLTLSAWLDEGPRRAQILATFIAAGRGLAAAHGVGIVHRDFKPDNVLIGAEGVARVVDFGLALALEDAGDSSADEEPLPRVAPRSWLGPAGTIFYMPLEQLLGHEVDARSDQFAFCVALYEALWGQPPFTRESPGARREALERDAPRRPEGGGLDGVWRVLRRGLRRDPAARWPDMGALLGALERVPRRRWAWGMASAAVVVLGIGVAGGTGLVWTDPCEQLQPAWGDEAREQLGLVFANPDHDERAELDRLYERLDLRELDWQIEYEQVCSQPRRWSVAKSDFERTRDQLAHHNRQTEAFLAYLEQDPQLLPEAAAVLAQLELDDFEHRRQALAPLENQLGEIRVARLFRNPEQALELSKGLAARSIGHDRLRAQVYAEIAKSKDVLFHPDAAFYYDEAIELAQEQGLDELLAELLSARIISSGPEQRARAEEELSAFADTLGRLGMPLHQHPRYLYARAYVEQLQDEPKLEQVRRDYEEALKREGTGPKQADYLRALGDWELRHGQLEQGLDDYEASLEAAKSFYGPRHRRTAMAYYQLAQAQKVDGKLKDPAPLMSAAEIWEDVDFRPLAQQARIELADYWLGEVADNDSPAAAMLAAETQLRSAFALGLDNPEQFAVQTRVYATRRNAQQALEAADTALDLYGRQADCDQDSTCRSVRALRAQQCVLARLPDFSACCYDLASYIARSHADAPEELREDCSSVLPWPPPTHPESPAEP